VSGSVGPADRAKLVRNERTKLQANALDRASTACFAVGVLGQAVGGQPTYGLWIWLGAFAILHGLGNVVLRRLQP
jgi:hypothetical protein